MYDVGGTSQGSHLDLQAEDSALDTGLGMGVVILDAVQQLAQAPIAVGLHRQQLRGSEGGRKVGQLGR